MGWVGITGDGRRWLKAEGTQRSPFAHLGNRVENPHLFIFPPVKYVLCLGVCEGSTRYWGMETLLPNWAQLYPQTQGDNGHYFSLKVDSGCHLVAPPQLIIGIPSFPSPGRSWRWLDQGGWVWCQDLPPIPYFPSPPNRDKM